MTNCQLEEKDYFELSHHEDNVINHRQNWLLAGQPLLFLAYANVITAKVGQGEKMLDPEAYKHAAKLIPWVGGLLAMAVWFGVLGAIHSLFLLSRRRKAGFMFGVSWPSSLLGLVPPFFVPLIFAYVWYKVAR